MSRTFIGPLRLALSFCLLLAGASGCKAGIEQQRALFLQAEQALNRGRMDEAERLIEALQAYPLYPYLLYRRLALDLDNSAAVQAFLVRYPQTRQAGQLRSRWLERLAARGAWDDYLRNYRETDNNSLQCNYYLALANLGRRQEALAGAEKLWASGTSLPESCDRLFSLWQASSGFTPEQIWKRFSLAMQKGNLPLVSYLQRLLPPPQKSLADFWLKVHDHPRMVLSCADLDPESPVNGLIFAHGIDKLASSEPLLAQTAWALHKSRFTIEKDEQARVDRRVALALAAQRYDQAGAYLLAVPQESADAQIRGWRVRAALLKQDWLSALAALDLLEPEEKKQAQWRYWRARALEALGDKPGALELYRLAAEERDFYGFNAADRIERNYPLAAQVAAISEAELDRLANSAPFLAIREFRALQRIGEARSDWMHAIKSLAPRQQAVAAKLAQQWGWDQLAIVTVAKAGYWDDLSLRFPLGYYQPVLKNAQQQQLDPAMVFGLIRRESAFDPQAGSPVGARGLMQLMPATGEQLARQFNEKLPSDGALLDPERNLRYGTAYFRGLLERFRNHFALAAAAYNAGPGRVDRWLPANRSLPADLWVETIPFSETRQYVSAVLSYAVFYQSRMGRPWQRITSFLPEILPGRKAEVKPDRAVSVSACE